jgi:IS30 family transposase
MQRCVKTIIFDNWKEFANYGVINKALLSTPRFASWRRGSNEDLSIILRQ